MTLPGVVDAVILITLAEVALLVVWHRMTGAGVAPREFAANLISGLCLMGALRCAIHDGGMPWIALFLLAAGIAHVTDLWRRWVRRPSSAPASGATLVPPQPKRPAG